jgi:recombination protein RecR
MNILPNKLKHLINKLTILPGVGPKSAQRMAIHILQHKKPEAQELAESLSDCIATIQTCHICQNLSDLNTCWVCSNPQRNQQLICVVQSLSDLISIEQTGVYSGRYFVLSGHLSPIDQIGPEKLKIPILLSQIQNQNIQEVIIATNATIEGEATAHYIISHITKPIKISRLASGIPMGTELEFLNNNTLYHAFCERKEIVTSNQ